MRTDLAALTPPLVMAAAFIAGVVALLRSQMAPRRGGDLTASGDGDRPFDQPGEMTPPEYSEIPGSRQNSVREDRCEENFPGRDAAGSDAQHLHVQADDGAISTAPEGHPPASPRT